MANDLAITLSDGRRLAYLDIGDPAGRPIISCHGGLSSRLDVAPAAPTASTLGVRLISPDRPGIGHSDSRPGRTLLDWPADVEQLADQLGLDTWSVMGWSAGGMYAQACAVCLPGRVTRLSLIASVIPRDWPGMIDQINRTDRIFMRLSHAGSPVERVAFSMLRTTARHRGEALVKRSGAPDELAREVGSALVAGLVDTRGAVQEYRLLDEPWGFDPTSITVPTHVWQGTADDLVPASWGERLAAAIPGAQLTVIDGGSHFLWYDHWDEILAALLA